MLFKISSALKDDKTQMWSFSRISGAVSLVWVFVVATVFVYLRGDVPTNITHVMELFMTFAGAAYGVNKGVSHFSKLGSTSIPIPEIPTKEDDVEA